MKLGRYEIVRELGKGAMGVVYLAKDPVIGRLVALKTIRMGSGQVDDDEAKEFQQRFVREAQAAGILNHPSIVTVHDIGQDDATGTSFIAMEYVEGQNLKDALTHGKPLGYEQVAEIIAQIAEALDFAHAKGIVHRDVKPANVILLSPSKAKITDFGIAKIASGVSNLTTTGQFLGTPNYMAPEQIKGIPVDGRTDIFALGICLYECLTRRKPFGGDSLTAISYKIVHEPFPPLHEVNPEIPAEFDEVLAHCLAKDPAKRYQRAGELAAALRAVARGEQAPAPQVRVIPDETMLTQDGKLPTLDVPYSPEPPRAGESTRRAAVQPPQAPPPSAGGKKVQVPGLFRARIHPAAFLGTVILLLAVLGGAAMGLRGKKVEVPQVDTAAEAQRERERTLREEGNALLAQGRVTDAYSKFQELQRIAPQSPFVLTMLQKLNAIREQEEVSRQQMGAAQAKFQEGMVYFNARRYSEAIDLFQEAYSLNPNSPETAEYLRLAQLEELKGRLARENTSGTSDMGMPAAPGSSAASAASPAGQRESSAAPAQITTVFGHRFTDGRVVVRIGGDTVANESLFVEKAGGLFRRSARDPRQVNVTRQFPAKNADVQIWVQVKNAGIQEHHVIPGVRFEGGTQHRLQIRFDDATKKFSYDLN